MNRITFTPYAFAKMLFLRDASTDEVSGFGVTPTRLDLIEDIAVPKQTVQSAYVDIDDTGLAVMVDELAQKGLQPEQFMRIWIHTHPKGMSPNPSSRDEQCMRESFSAPDWAVMMIMSQSGQNFARLHINKPFLITKELEIAVDWYSPFPAANIPAWKEEYTAKVSKKTYPQQAYGHFLHSGQEYSSYGQYQQTQKAKKRENLPEFSDDALAAMEGDDTLHCAETEAMGKLFIEAQLKDEALPFLKRIYAYHFRNTPLTKTELLNVMKNALVGDKVSWGDMYDDIRNTTKQKRIGIISTQVCCLKIKTGIKYSAIDMFKKAFHPSNDEKIELEQVTA